MLRGTVYSLVNADAPVSVLVGYLYQQVDLVVRQLVAEASHDLRELGWAYLHGQGRGKSSRSGNRTPSRKPKPFPGINSPWILIISPRGYSSNATSSEDNRPSKIPTAVIPEIPGTRSTKINNKVHPHRRPADRSSSARASQISHFAPPAHSNGLRSSTESFARAWSIRNNSQTACVPSALYFLAAQTASTTPHHTHYDPNANSNFCNPRASAARRAQLYPTLLSSEPTLSRRKAYEQCRNSTF